MGNEKKSRANDRLSSALAGIVIFIIAALIITVVVLSVLLIHEHKKSLPTSVVMTETDEKETIVKKYEVTVEYLEKALVNISELSTAELSCTGICTVEDGDIPLINKKGFSMLYKGTVKAGIDASDIDIDITDKEVIIKLPKAQLWEPVVDPNSIKFYDEKKALFNWTELRDSVDGMILAQEDMRQQAESDGILEKADKQAEYIVRGLLEDIVKEADGKRTLKIVRSDPGTES